MNLWILSYLAFGALFGLLSYPRRHLFSEGPTRRADAGTRGVADGRLMWLLICTALWPIMLLTGLHSVLRMARVPRDPRP